MDNLWFSRLLDFVRKELAEDITLNNITRWAYLVAEFVEDFTKNNKEYVSLSSVEKHKMYLAWVERVVFEVCGGKKLSPLELQIISGMIALVCEITKHGSMINNNSTGHSLLPPVEKLTEVPLSPTTTTPISRKSTLRSFIGCPCTKPPSTEE